MIITPYFLHHYQDFVFNPDYLIHKSYTIYGIRFFKKRKLYTGERRLINKRKMIEIPH